MRWLPLCFRSRDSIAGRKRGALTLEWLEDRNLPSLTITPTFDSTIAGDPNAAAIQGTINAAIDFYENAFSNPIDVTIQFKVGKGLGTSTVAHYLIPYETF